MSLVLGMNNDPVLAVRTVLSRHPVAVDCVRAASALFGGQTDIAVFAEGRAFVVASDDGGRIIQPRQLIDIELELQQSNAKLATSPTAIAVPIRDGDGQVIGSITSVGSHAPAHHVPLLALARIVSGLAKGQKGTTNEFALTVLEGLRDTVAVLNSSLEITWCNRSIGSLLGRTPAEVIGTSAVDLVHPDDVDLALNTLVRMSEGLEVYRATIRLKRGDGDYELVDATGLDHANDPLIDGVVLSLRSAEIERETNVIAARTNSMSEAIVRGLSDGIVATDGFGAITMINEVARTLFGLGGGVRSLVRLGDLELVDASGQPCTASDLVTSQPTGTFVVAADGNPRYLTVSVEPILDNDDVEMGTVLMFHDVTNERLAADELRTQALHDQLTGLANRRQLEQRLKELRASAEELTIAACFIDLDGFKHVNDLYGHRAGDELIRLAATRLSHQLREQDLLVRQGGDEFVALLVDVENIDAVGAIAERLRSTLEETYVVGEERFNISASIGVSIVEAHELDEERILQQADLALYSAKNLGRNRVEVFDDVLAEASSTEDQQRRLLTEAIEDDRLVVHFQPLVEAVSGRTVGYEALVRIETDNGTILGPSGFLATVSETYRMWELDQIALSRACEGASVLQRISPDAPPYIACNFSPVSIVQPDFVGVVQKVVADAGLTPAQICIEITETAAFEAGEAGLRTLVALHKAGFLLSLDDFGTGYSSLAHLRDLPISLVKVDRSFIGKLERNPSERAIVEAIVTLAHDLGLSVVAEGVENFEQRQITKELGFETLQGWYFSPALSLAECLHDWATNGAGHHDETGEVPEAA